MAVLRAHFAHARFDGTIAVFHLLGRLARRAESAINRQIGLGSHQTAKGYKVIKSHVVRLHPVGPHHLQPRRALIPIANPIAPVVGRDKVAAGPFEHLEALFFVKPNHLCMKTLHIIGRHQRSSSNVKRAAAAAQNLQTRILRVGCGSEFQRELPELARERRNRDYLRVAAAGPPNQPDHNFSAGIAGKENAAIVALAASQAQFGLLNAAGLGAVQRDARAVLADKWPNRVHCDGSCRPHRLEWLAHKTPERGVRWRKRSIGNRVRELSVAQHLGPYLRGRRLHVTTKDQRIDRLADLGRIDRDLDASSRCGEGRHPLLHKGGARH